ncbi:hypothetical protein CBSLWZGG_CDS6 [Pseudomonas phage PseuPha1]|uniref:Uncharacterized protein n=1 Tax=Pseudomonas phage Baskent_P3_3B TaxID=3145033 RepID=A0AAU8BC49_9CAUD|nr:hypothetical protein CBSLWZGG_CDS6 [Pseudomonas phage PseuPha1]
MVMHRLCNPANSVQVRNGAPIHYQRTRKLPIGFTLYKVVAWKTLRFLIKNSDQSR